mgnify:CR=1 FL=1
MVPLARRIAFQSTPPGWEATPCVVLPPARRMISIHASRVGGDHYQHHRSSSADNFNPRLPGGRRPNPRRSWCQGMRISIHASRVGGDRAAKQGETITDEISIHASRVGGDKRIAPAPLDEAAQFQSTPPGWEATPCVVLPLARRMVFQSTPPGWEATVVKLS